MSEKDVNGDAVFGMDVDTGAEEDNGRKRGVLETVKHKLTTKNGLIGDYDYKDLCMPRIPFTKMSQSPSVFFGLHDSLPLLVGILMGFQHALAMVGGVITVPRILAGAGPNHLQLDPETAAYLVSSSLIISGLMSFVQILRFRLVKGYYIGTGLISLSGTSFTFLPIAEAAIQSMRDDGFCPTEGPCPQAYGRWLGTVAVGALLEIGLSFVPNKALRRVFPPVVTGTTVFLIGASLVGTGISYWAGGAGPCKEAALPFFERCPNVAAEKSFPWGDAHWIGLGFFVLAIIILVEIFGSPFLRNTQIMVGLIAGIILSAALNFLNQEAIDSAPWITFLWVRTFGISFYVPALIPVLIGYAVSTVETVGDITASCEASRVETVGPMFESRVQGGLLADGVNSVISALMTGNPTTTFSQNNAVIAMTRTANRYAGIWAAIWLLLFGIVGKIGGIFIAIPDAVLGGMTTFLFANVTVSGIRILSGLKWERRDRFILAVALAVGLGVVIVPETFRSFIPDSESEVVRAFTNGVEIMLSTGYCIGAIIASLLNFVVPHENEALNADKLVGKDYSEAKNAEISDDVEVDRSEVSLS
mmetsp:Transcript_3019/g.9250  ORF Transcript_3019/g.9250 Transcript_3019/m.9250 type:complete len:588 (+) Transcript_3019:50-1813(+)|eukprot:CAMPEP_0198735300 /NCGR_PEP_ID=MMETSP1475-20131203/58495_1 /TAXON_ID= ORGANISM="Unidentified sp., Strain CCMP1999" /NCGR_SAMPLE_ID=MMETSP1475 /ASSEMBLY_ACC=CAM_ASM_001111 /LENGTH=587 /DNA_ID=CAMNT_0044498931 /DNA_START=49 /DNA_END=1812 /DNA_ORIENTATION=-